MGILINTGFDLGSGSPLDNRTLKDTIAERDALVSEGKVHENLKVYCKDTQKEYRWTGTDWETVVSGGDLTNYQKKTDNTLDTTDKTITGSINEVNGNLLDTVGFSADYKNIILNRKSGLNPYTIPISAIINNTSLAELKDIDSTDIGNGKILVYDAATNKHKYVDSSTTDELVKMDNTTGANYLINLIDKSTIVNDNGVLKVKKLYGQEVTITEINYLKGLTMNVMDLVSAFANGGVKVWETPVNTYADLATLDRSAFINGISYIVYVLIDETHSNAKTTYLCTKTSTTFFGNADSQRNFTTNPIDLANEVTGKLDNSHIDVDSLWSLLTIDDTYKTLTVTDNVFGTHGAKAMYDELTTSIGGKANASDLTTHTGDTDIHVTSSERTKWDKVTDKLDVVDFNTHTGDTDIHITSDERIKWNNKANASDIPTKTSELTNDSNYVTEEAVNDKFEEANVYKGKYVGDLNDIPFIKSGVVYKYDIRSGNCTNTPVDTHGILYSTYFDGNNYCLQEFHSLQTNKAGIYRRDKGTGVWSDWRELATMDKLSASLGEKVSKEEIKNFKNVHVSQTTLGITIENGQDNTRKVFDALGVGERYQDYWGNSSSTSKWGIAESYGNTVQIEIVKVGLGYGVCTAMTNKGITLQRYIDTSMTKMLDWQRLYVTTVADVGVTTITPVNSAITGTMEYTVKNGICYVSLKNVKSTTNNNGLSISTTMPKPAINSSSEIVKEVGNGNIGFVYINKNTTQLKANISIADIIGSCSFSYPVAE